jgi:hypothetical protein
MKTYKLLKDLPHIPAGIEGKPNSQGNYFKRTNGEEVFYDYRVMEENPDFFEEVKDEKKLFDLSDMRKMYDLSRYKPTDEGFKNIVKSIWPHIKID